VARHVTNGFRSEWGRDLFADIRSIVNTGQRQGLSAFQAISWALDPTKSLFPLGWAITIILLLVEHELFCDRCNYRHCSLNPLRKLTTFPYLRSCTILNKWVSAAQSAAETHIYRSRAPHANGKCERCKI
jgi:hypothetical protein